MHINSLSVRPEVEWKLVECFKNRTYFSKSKLNNFQPQSYKQDVFNMREQIYLLEIKSECYIPELNQGPLS